MSETELEMVERHVRDGEAVVEKQRALIHDLHDQGHDTQAAEYLLALFNECLASHYDHRDRLKG